MTSLLTRPLNWFADVVATQRRMKVATTTAVSNDQPPVKQEGSVLRSHSRRQNLPLLESLGNRCLASPVRRSRGSALEPADARKKETVGKQANHRLRGAVEDSISISISVRSPETRKPSRFGLPFEYRGSDCSHRLPSHFDLDVAAAVASTARRTIDA